MIPRGISHKKLYEKRNPNEYFVALCENKLIQFVSQAGDVEVLGGGDFIGPGDGRCHRGGF